MRHVASMVAVVTMLVAIEGPVGAVPGTPAATQCDRDMLRAGLSSCDAWLVSEGQVDRAEAPMQTEQRRMWRATSPAALTASDQERLALILRLADSPDLRLIQNDAGSLALVAASGELGRALTSLGDELGAEHVRPGEVELVVLLAALDETTSGETLVRWLEETGAPLGRVWIAVPRERPASDPARSWLQARGTAAVGRLELPSGAGAAELIADLYPLDPEVAQRFVSEKLRAAEPVAEGPDNLDGRAEWFRRRAGPTR